MDHDHDRRRAGGSARASAAAGDPHPLAPGKRTLTEGLVVQRLEVGADNGVAAAATRAPTPARPLAAVASSPSPTLQMLFGVQRAATADEDRARVHAAAARGMATPASRLPHADRIQRAFGPHDISGIQAHVGADSATSAREMGARAYAIEDHVVLGEAVELHTVAHEAAHVVQQRRGVHLRGGVGEAGDAYERHADAVADRVARGESAADLLDAGAGGSTRGAAPGTRAVQRSGPGERTPWLNGPPNTRKRKHDAKTSAEDAVKRAHTLPFPESGKPESNPESVTVETTETEGGQWFKRLKCKVKLDGKSVGWGTACIDYSDRTLKIEELVVAKEHRKCGYGRVLMLALCLRAEREAGGPEKEAAGPEKEAADVGLWNVTLVADENLTPDLRGYYGRVGFECAPSDEEGEKGERPEEGEKGESDKGDEGDRGDQGGRDKEGEKGERAEEERPEEGERTENGRKAEEAEEAEEAERDEGSEESEKSEGSSEFDESEDNESEDEESEESEESDESEDPAKQFPMTGQLSDILAALRSKMDAAGNQHFQYVHR